MRPCKFDNQISLLKFGNCDKCPLHKDTDKNFTGKITSINQIVPEGLCPFAYFSIIPYWVSFNQNAWFRWMINKDEVVCQCPKSNGVIFLIKNNKAENKINAKIIGVGNCKFHHKLDQNFDIKNDYLCPALFPSLWTQLESLNDNNNELEIQCGISTNSIIIKNDTINEYTEVLE